MLGGATRLPSSRLVLIAAGRGLRRASNAILNHHDNQLLYHVTCKARCRNHAPSQFQMADKMEVDEEEGPSRHLLSVESIKLMGESVGVSTLKEDAAVKLSEDLEYRLKEIIQNALKFMRHSKRSKLVCGDIDNALREKNVEPLYGFDCAEYVPFRHTSGGGKELYFPEEKDIDLIELINSPMPRLPVYVTMRAHWLSVDGVQPSVAGNPAPIGVEKQREEALAKALPHESEAVAHVKDVQFSKKGKKKAEPLSSGSEWTKLKPLQAHALSIEQQLYYKEIAEACIGSSDSKRSEAMNSLATDPGLYQLLPQFTSYITEGIRMNIAQRKLAILKHVLKMINALLENPTLTLDKYLHELIPSVLTCLITKQLCLRPEAEDHWSVREVAAKILAKICKKYSNSVNNIQSRITRTFSQALKNNTQGLAVHYGAILGLVELGSDALMTLVMPLLKREGELIKATQSQPGKFVEHVAANKLQSLLQRHCAPVLMNTRPMTDTVQQYQEDYGNMGQPLFNQVKTLRQNRAQLPQQIVTARVQSSAVKSPTTPVLKKPPPLSITSPQVTGVKSSAGVTTPGRASSPISIASLSSPTIAATLRLIGQPGTTSSSAANAGTPIPVTLLSAVMSNPAFAEQIAAALQSGNQQQAAATAAAAAQAQETKSTTNGQTPKTS